MFLFAWLLRTRTTYGLWIFVDSGLSWKLPSVVNWYHFLTQLYASPWYNNDKTFLVSLFGSPNKTIASVLILINVLTRKKTDSEILWDKIWEGRGKKKGKIEKTIRILIFIFTFLVLSSLESIPPLSPPPCFSTMVIYSLFLSKWNELSTDPPRKNWCWYCFFTDLYHWKQNEWRGMWIIFKGIIMD